MAKRERILFVCENDRGPDHPKGSCCQAGATTLRNALKVGIQKRGLRKRVRVCGATCLDLCHQGPAMVVMPDNVYYGRVTEDDIDDILGSLETGQPIGGRTLPEDGFDEPRLKG